MIPVSALPPDFNIAEVSGPGIIAYLLHWGLFGTLSVQLFLYYEAFPKDRKFNKCLVYGIYLVEFVQTMLITHDAFQVFAPGFGDVKVLTEIHFDWLTGPIMSGLVSLVGQSFYAYRIFALSRSWMLPALIMAVSITSSIGGFVTGAFSFIAGNITLLNNRRISIAAGVWCGSSALSDLMIAVCMTYYLSKSDSGFRRTQVLISKIIRLTIETGSLTAAVALANLILFFAFPGKTYYGTPVLILPKLYANTILMVLNARFQIVGGRSYSSSDSMNTLPSFILRDSGTTGSNANSTTGLAPIVVVKKEVFDERDLDDRVEMKALNASSRNNYV